MQIFLLYCYSAILLLELHCSTILKVIIFFFPIFWLALSLTLYFLISFLSHDIFVSALAFAFLFEPTSAFFTICITALVRNAWFTTFLSRSWTLVLFLRSTIGSQSSVKALGYQLGIVTNSERATKKQGEKFTNRENSEIKTNKEQKRERKRNTKIM